jgi:hypothetical protein
MRRECGPSTVETHPIPPPPCLGPVHTHHAGGRSSSPGRAFLLRVRDKSGLAAPIHRAARPSGAEIAPAIPSDHSWAPR